MKKRPNHSGTASKSAVLGVNVIAIGVPTWPGAKGARKSTKLYRVTAQRGECKSNGHP